MLIAKLHEDEADIDTDVVARLVADQFPRWAGLPLRPVATSGTSNAMLRLGEGLVVRLPRVASAVPGLLKEARYAGAWGDGLGVAVPRTAGRGEPGSGFPWPWAVVEWIPGTPLAAGRAPDALVADLGAAVRALRSLPLPVPDADADGTLTSYRGEALDARDAVTREAISASGDLLPVTTLTAAWELVLAAADAASTASRGGSREWPRAWIHTDLQPANLLASAGRLAGILDWGGAAVGDPAIDLIPAWNLCTAAQRALFRAAAGVEPTADGRPGTADDATWLRARGWALSVGLVAYPYYRDSHPELASVSRYQVEQVVSEVRGTVAL